MINNTSYLRIDSQNTSSLFSNQTNNLQKFKSFRNQTMGDSSNLKSDAIMELMKQHLSTDAGKDIVKKIGLVYQIQISPKVLV